MKRTNVNESIWKKFSEQKPKGIITTYVVTPDDTIVKCYWYEPEKKFYDPHGKHIRTVVKCKYWCTEEELTNQVLSDIKNK